MALSNGFLLMSERVLLHTEARFNALLDSLEDGLLLCEPGGCIRLVSGPFRRLLETGAGGVGEDVRRFAPLLRLGLGDDVAALLDRGTEFDRRVEFGGDRDPRPCRLQGRAVRGPDGELLEALLLVRDETAALRHAREKKLLQLQLQRSQRMESFGLLAAGIAHDLNNVLSCVMGAGDMLLADGLDDGTRLRLARQVIGASERGAEMTRKVLSLARQDDDRRQPVNVGQVMRDVMVLLRRSIDPRIEIEMQVESGPLAVLADPATLHQILMNLGVNARDAMPDGGRLQVACRRMSVGEALADSPAHAAGAIRVGDVRSWLARPDDWMIRVELGDTGQGIPAERMASIFEAFYTTKDAGKGTGLGLSMVRQAVEEHEGWLDLSSEPGVGTVFRIHLPLLGDDRGAAELAAKGTRLVRGRGRVLLVDDDEVVRQTTAEMLGALGYEVGVARDGLDALEVFTADPTGFDLIVLDLMMPHMDGIETLRRVVALRPDQKVLVATGYANRSIVDDLKRIADVPVMMKPFRFAELSERISALLG